MSRSEFMALEARIEDLRSCLKKTQEHADEQTQTVVAEILGLHKSILALFGELPCRARGSCIAGKAVCCL